MKSATLCRMVLLCVAAAPFSASGCAPSQGDPGLIKIVSSMPRTGSAKAQTDTIVNGIRLALEEAHFRAGDFDIEYLDWDDATAAAGQWTAEAERANADRAIKDPDVMVYIGTYNSGAAKISMPMLNYASLLMISPANSSVELTKPPPDNPLEINAYRPTGKLNYCRVVPADDLQADLSVGWAKELGVKKVYILDDNEVYGRGIAKLFNEQCYELGIEVLGHESIDSKRQEFRSLMTSIKATGPDLVYFGGTTQSKGGQIAKDMVSVGLDAKLMVPDGCFEQAFIEAAGAENLDGRCYVTFGGKAPEQLTGVGKKFVEKYKAKYQSDPEAYATYGYECARVALAAIEKAGRKDRAAITAACLATQDFDGVLGTWSFDKNGDTTINAITGCVVRDGKFEFVKLLGE